MSNDFVFHPIATVRSCYKEKFGIPRQPGFSTHAKSIIEFTNEYNNEEFVRQLDSFSHIWVVFVFHQHMGKEVKATVRPPRLGGNKKIGVFASRSSFRPNPIGLSVVKLEKITRDNNLLQLHVRSADFVDGTPVIDIKPYIAYADSIYGSIDGYASTKPQASIDVVFSDRASKQLSNYFAASSDMQSLIIETLSLDPRPAYIDDESREYGVKLDNYNIRWKVKNNIATVIEIVEL